MYYQGILSTPRSSYQTPPLQKKNDIEDRGGNHELFEHLMHSWVGYELVKVLLKYGLSPKLWGDLNKWSPDLYKLFSYFGNKKRDSSKSPTRLRTKFEKMANTTIPLVILTWLRQLQEPFFSNNLKITHR